MVALSIHCLLKYFESEKFMLVEIFHSYSSMLDTPLQHKSNMRQKLQEVWGGAVEITEWKDSL